MGSLRTTLPLCVLAMVVAGLLAASVYAVRSTSTNYQLDSTVGASITGTGDTPNYSLVSTGGESLAGNTMSDSYKLTSGYTSHLEKSLQVTAQPHGLLAYYPLDEPSGMIAFDASASGLNATAADLPPRQAGQIGKALGALTSSSGQYLVAEASSTLDTTSFTVCAWANKSAVATSPTIVARADGGFAVDGMWYLGFDDDLKPQFAIHLGGAQVLTSENSVSTNAWHQICGTYDGSTMRLYVDGVQTKGQSLVGPLPAIPSQALSIGARSDGSHTSTSQAIDEVKLYDTLLSVSQIKAEYDAGQSGRAAGLSFGTIIAGTPATAGQDVSVQADGVGYTLAISENHDLTQGGNTIPAISGSINSPLAWDDDTTEGLGFTVYGDSAGELATKWSSGAAYAALPTTPTTFYSRDGSAGAARDTVDLQYKINVRSEQVTGSYTNQVTITGTIKP